MNVGEVVTLKSGGPPMTVEHVEPGPVGTIVRCVWFEAQPTSVVGETRYDGPRRAAFAPSLLVAAAAS